VETFVVRVWLPAEDDTRATAEMRGFVNHVGSGGSNPFRGIDELLALLRSGIGTRTPQEEEEGPTDRSQR